MSGSLKNFVFEKNDCMMAPGDYLSAMIGSGEPIDRMINVGATNREVVLPAGVAGVTKIEYLGQKPEVLGEAPFGGLRVRLGLDTVLVVRFSSCQPSKKDIFVKKTWVIHS